MMRTLLRIIFLLGFLALIIGTLIFLFNKSKEKPVVFATKSPIMTDIVEKAVANGSIVPRREIEIKPQVSGVVDTIYVVPGQSIQKGDLLAKVKIIPDLVTLNLAESRLKQAQIKLNDAKLAFDRRKALYDKHIIADSEYQEYELAYDSAKEEVDTAQNNLALIREGIAQNSDTTSNTLIRSTISGMVLAVPIEEGNFVTETNTFNQGTTIANVADMGEMIFKGYVDESEVGKLKPGMDLIIKIGAIENESFHAALEYISPKGVEKDGTIQFEIKAKVDLKPELFIRAGYSANADIVLESRKDVMAIDEGLLQFEKDKIYVEVETVPQQFEKRYIQTGLSDGIHIQVLSGLSLKDHIKVAN